LVTCSWSGELELHEVVIVDDPDRAAHAVDREVARVAGQVLAEVVPGEQCTLRVEAPQLAPAQHPQRLVERHVHAPYFARGEEAVEKGALGRQVCDAPVIRDPQAAVVGIDVQPFDLVEARIERAHRDQALEPALRIEAQDLAVVLVESPDAAVLAVHDQAMRIAQWYYAANLIGARLDLANGIVICVPDAGVGVRRQGGCRDRCDDESLQAPPLRYPASWTIVGTSKTPCQRY
jgi:hypothetical protein